MIDATFASPVNFKPAAIGYDIVLHSATKYLNGHSDLAAGVIAAAVAGWLAIGLLLRYLRTHSTGIFIAYRLVVAAIFLVLLLVNG